MLNMKQPGHLCGFENELKNGTEWRVSAEYWLIMQLHQGIAYARSANSSVELDLGGLIVIPPGSSVSILASRLENVLLRCLGLRLDALGGVLSSIERSCLESVATLGIAPLTTLPEQHIFSQRFKHMWRLQEEMGALQRVKLLDGFIEFVAPHLSKGVEMYSPEEPDIRDRLRRIMSAVPESELTELSIAELARQLNCCERHASRLFFELFGRSLRKHVSDIRLDLACRLLQDGRRKIIDVALESGHGSLASFNTTFKRRFGVTPSEWRGKLERSKAATRRGLYIQRATFGAVLASIVIAVLLATQNWTPSFKSDGNHRIGAAIRW